MLTKIEVLKDTNIVMENTADSLRAVLTYEDTITDYETGNGKITGTDLKNTSYSSTTLGDLKNTLTRLSGEISDYETRIVKANQDIVATQALINIIQPEVDKAIAEIQTTNETNETVK